MSSQLPFSAIEAKYEALNATVYERDKDAVTEIFQEANLRQQLVDVQKRLLKYETLFGTEHTAPTDSQVILQQLEAKQKELDKLKEKESSWEQVC